jgi:hypothetical protein
VGLFGAYDVEELIIFNPMDGSSTLYAVEDVPQWVDRVFPSDLLITQYNWSGLYLNGWLNSWLGQTGVKQTTPGSNGLAGYNYIAKDDDVWLYTGVTSATADNSIIGFVLINQRTGESHFYSVSGATEISAMYSAEGQVQNLRYVSTFPLLLNINNQPTYFMALKDAAGLVKMYAMVNVNQYQIVATGATVGECERNYRQMLANNGMIDDTDAQIKPEDMALFTVEGVVEDIRSAVIDGNTHYYVKVDSHDGWFAAAAGEVIQLILLDEGDYVKIQAIASAGGISQGIYSVEVVPAA